MTWVFLVLAYGIIKGFREIFKKKALEKSSTIEVLFFYTFISFILVLPEMKGAFSTDFSTLAVVALKSFTIFLAWICGFKAIGQMPVSLYGILDLSRVLFSTGLGVIIIGESLGKGQVIGLILVVIGLLLLKINPEKIVSKSSKQINTDSSNSADAASGKSSLRKNGTFYVILAFISAFLNAVSGTMDKLIMTNTDITEGHLQFWYMLFLVLFYLMFILVNLGLNKFRKNNGAKNEKGRTGFVFRLVPSLKNYWIWILAVIFVIADRCLFIANADPNSTVTVMTLIKQSCSIVTIVAGKLVFHEKNILHKLFCALVIISGIVISVLL